MIAFIFSECSMGSLPTVATGDPDIQPVWKRAFELLKAAGKEFGEDKCSRMAAAIAYRTVFALAPLLLVAVAVAALFLDAPVEGCEPGSPGCATVQQQLVGQVAQVSEPLATTVDDIMDNAADSASANGIIGTALFLFTASSLFFEIQRSLNTVFDAPDEQTKGIMATVRARGIGALAVLVLGAVLVVLLAANAIVSAAGSLLIGWIDAIGLPGDVLAPLLSYVGPLVTIALLIVLFAIQFQTFTVVTIPWKSAWRGGAVTAVAFAVGALGLGAYFSFQATQEDGVAFSAGGFAGGAVLILFLVFMLAQIYLFGAEFTKVYADYVDHGDIVQPSKREERRRPEIPAQEVRAAATKDLIASVGVLSFLAGLVLGWFRRP